MRLQSTRKGYIVPVSLLILLLWSAPGAFAEATPAGSAPLAAVLMRGMKLGQQIWWNQPEVVKTLELKDEQRAKMDQLLAQARGRQRASQQQQAETRKAFEQALTSANWEAARQAGAGMAQGAAAIATIQNDVKIDVLALLNDAQRHTLAARYAHVLRRPWLVSLPPGGIHLEGKGR